MVSLPSWCITATSIRRATTFNNNIRQDPLMFGSERPHLRQGSPAIDTGNNTAIYIQATDFDGDSRIIDGDENGTATADMGADEFVPGAAFGVWYVDSDVTTSGSGTSWDQALKTIEEAVGNAIADDEIWVKAGTYTPTGGAVIAPLHITVANVGLYGGFAGGESLREQRDWLANETIINGGATFTRTIHVSDAGGGATIDGFTITGFGGTTAAIEFFSVSGLNTVANCKFTANSKNSVKSTSSDLQVLNSSFISNTYNALNTSGPGTILTVRDSLFKDNTATALSALNSTSIDRCQVHRQFNRPMERGCTSTASVALVTLPTVSSSATRRTRATALSAARSIFNFGGLLGVKDSTFYGNSAAEPRDGWRDRRVDLDTVCSPWTTRFCGGNCGGSSELFGTPRQPDGHLQQRRSGWLHRQRQHPCGTDLRGCY